MRIPVTFTIGDALEVPADLAVIGPSPELKKSVERATGSSFKDYAVNSYLAQAPASKWKRVLSLRYGSSEKLSRPAQSEMHEALSFAVQEFRPETIVMVPLSYRHPDTVALAMLYQLWLLYSADRFRDGVNAGIKIIQTIKIIDKAELSVFQALLGPDAKRLEEYIKTEYERTKGYAPLLAETASDWSIQAEP